MTKQNTIVAVGQTLSYEAGLLAKVIDPDSAKVAKAFKRALRDKKRVTALLKGLVEDNQLAI